MSKIKEMHLFFVAVRDMDAKGQKTLDWQQLFTNNK